MDELTVEVDGEPEMQPPPEPTPEELAAKAEQEFADRVAAWQERHQEAEHALSQACIALSAAKDQVKACREAVDEATEFVLMVEASEPRRPGEAVEQSVAVPQVEEAASADWRAALVSELAISDAIKARLQENGIATIGELEDLRAGNGLLSLRGVGRTKADAIEDALLAWLSEHRDNEAFRVAADIEAETGRCAPAAENTTLAETSSQDCEFEPPAAFYDEDQAPLAVETSDPDVENALQIERLAMCILDDRQSNRDGVMFGAMLKDSRYWQAGKDAFHQGVPTCECPWVDDALKDWLRGWLYARSEMNEDSDSEESENGNDAAPSASEAEAVAEKEWW